MAIKIEMLRCFAMVAQHGSLSIAAANLGRTPAAVSMMLKQFEDHIGSPLFETARKSKLTPIGKMIFAEAHREIAHFENTVAVIEGLSRSELGHLRLAVTPSVASSILPRIINQFVRMFPSVQLDLRDMDSGAIAQELAAERADIGIGSLPKIDGLERHPLFSDAFGVVCRKDHPLAESAAGVTWQQVSEHALIANGLGHLILDPEFELLIASSRLMVRNTASLLGLVRQGVGVTVLPQLALPDMQDDLMFVPLADTTARRSVYICHHPKNILMPAAREFLDLIDKMSEKGFLNSEI